MFRLALILGLTIAGPAFAQHHGHAAPPYAALAERPVKALSAQEAADLAAGRGMGLALAAELNGYPGPLHVLELAERLELTAGQRTQAQALLEAMTAEAIPIGRQVITGEEELDRLFATRRATIDAITELSARIAAARGQLRAAHLRYHLAMIDILQPAQVARYGALRGY